MRYNRVNDPYYVYNVKEGDTVYWHNDNSDNNPLSVTKVTKMYIVCDSIKFYRATGSQPKRTGISHITVCEI
jgi:hypothetical protein